MARTHTKFVPGPNSYSLKSKVGEGPAFVMGDKTKDGSVGGPKAVPGPGAYSPVRVTDVSAAYSASSASAVMQVQPTQQSP